MGGDESDSDRAHLDFRRQRMADLDSEFRQSMEQLGIYGVKTAQGVTLEQCEQLTQTCAAAFRQWGNAALADRFLAAHVQAVYALERWAQFLAVGKGRGLTDLERARADSAENAADDASEHLERVQADVRAYLEGLDEKGTA
jgi:hypothetical protein